MQSTTSSVCAVVRVEAMRQRGVFMTDRSFSSTARLRQTAPRTGRTGFRLYASGFSDMSDESLQKALDFQQKQSQEPRPSPKRPESKPVASEKPKEGAEESEEVQDALADRLGGLAEQQVRDAIQRQVGATRADWVDADAPDSDESAATSEISEEPSISPADKKAPVKRFRDGSVMYTAEQLSGD